MQSGLKILVVEDNPTILKLISTSLEKIADVHTASDGADALMKAVDLKPDLIISDYSMPVMDGRALLEKLRTRSETQAVPFVFLASQKEIDERLRMVVDGVEDYIVKPFFARDLIRQARRILMRIHQQKMEGAGAGGGKIKGSLTELSVIDWMQSLDQGRKTCKLTFRSGDSQCSLFFVDGQVVHARLGDIVGDEAVFKVLAWTDGEWELDFSGTTEEKTTTMSTQVLMLEGLRIIDEARRS
jgi:CheY-like chemotaxis protein